MNQDPDPAFWVLTFFLGFCLLVLILILRLIEKLRNCRLEVITLKDAEQRRWKENFEQDKKMVKNLIGWQANITFARNLEWDALALGMLQGPMFKLPAKASRLAVAAVSQDGCQTVEDFIARIVVRSSRVGTI